MVADTLDSLKKGAGVVESAEGEERAVDGDELRTMIREELEELIDQRISVALGLTNGQVATNTEMLDRLSLLLHGLGALLSNCVVQRQEHVTRVS